MADDAHQQVQANIRGFGKIAETVYAVVNRDSGLVVIAKCTALNPDRRPGCAVVGNCDGPRDFLFTEAMMLEAVQAFFDLRSGDLLDFLEPAVRANPESGIEPDGVNASGRVYRFSPDITAVQVATLVICLYAQRFGAIRRMEGMRAGLAALHDDLEGDVRADLDLLKGGGFLSI